MRWAIITGEYPPKLGGVSDYTRQVACGLAQAGDEVHVWAPPGPEPLTADAGVHPHRLRGNFDPRSLASLGRALDNLGRHRLLVQYGIRSVVMVQDIRSAGGALALFFTSAWRVQSGIAAGAGRTRGKIGNVVSERGASEPAVKMASQGSPQDSQLTAQRAVAPHRQRQSSDSRCAD